MTDAWDVAVVSGRVRMCSWTVISGNEAEVDVEKVDEVTNEDLWFPMPLAVMTSLTDWLFSGLVSSLKSPVRGTHLEFKKMPLLYHL